MSNTRAFVIGAVMVALTMSATAHARTDPAASAFGRLKALTGIWRPVDNPDSPLRIRFSLTAGGTVLVEEWTRHDQPHSLKLYHRDGPDLIATHYCPLGNQPRMSMVEHGEEGDIRFAIRDVTDLDGVHESHAVQIEFDLSGRPLLTWREVDRMSETEEASEVGLARLL